jgi:ATP-dependent Lon protease
LEEIDQTVRAALRFVPVETVDQVFDEVLCPMNDSVREEPAESMAAFAPVMLEKAQDHSLRQ